MVLWLWNLQSVDEGCFFIDNGSSRTAMLSPVRGIVVETWVAEDAGLLNKSPLSPSALPRQRRRSSVRTESNQIGPAEELSTFGDAEIISAAVREIKPIKAPCFR
ncbi:hypothetical protein CLCR_01355 [Cladophialophora carrionii]|uniref:Uncharacterized protein n=1 Tax=Cladophialophora carrionii TaxID=86049 RepID=A0A1C1CCH3_9EURO|nr:hypothetical protein CLCR_01355 [Cladophialophora carrionii]